MPLQYASHINLAAIALTFSLAAPIALAQQPATQRTQSSNNAAQCLLNGLNFGPMIMSFEGAKGAMIDFTRSSARVLIERSDVRSELFIDPRQRDDLSALDQEGNSQLDRKILEVVIQNTVNNPDFKALAQLGTGKQPNPAAIQEVLNTCFSSMQDGLQSFQASLDGKEEAVLNPKQIKRLRELDLQWRGMLALSDKKVADELKITSEQKTVVDAALKGYLATQMETLMPLMNEATQYSQQAAGSKRAPRTLDEQGVQSAVVNAMQSDTMTKARASAEDKVKVALTADQLTQWKTMIGKKFYFTRLD